MRNVEGSGVQGVQKCIIMVTVVENDHCSGVGDSWRYTMNRWAILLGNQLIFTTEDEQVARRFMAMGNGFRVYDHRTGYYVYMDAPISDACDLLVDEGAIPS